jgi:hypothetical protein
VVALQFALLLRAKSINKHNINTATKALLASKKRKDFLSFLDFLPM